MPTKTTKITRKPKPQPLALAPQIQEHQIEPAILEQALTGADLGGLKPENRITYYLEVCKSLQLNHLTRPFLFATIDGKTVMYATKDCTEQLRKRDGITIKIHERKTEDGLHIVIARASTATREDEAIGVEPMAEPDFVLVWNKQSQRKEPEKNPLAAKPLSPANRAKAMMKAETKAKRRVTLSIAGLGIPDESEIESIITEEIPINGQAVSAEATEKAAVAQIEAAGGKVTEIKAEVLPPTPKDWTQVKSHVGKANGVWLGVALGDMNPHVLQSLHDDWAAQQTAPNAKDAALIEAVKAGIAAGRGVTEDTPETPATPPEAQTTAPEPVKVKEPAKRAKATPAKESDLEPKPLAWRSVKVCVENKKVFGKELGEFEKDSAIMRSIIRQLVPVVTNKPEGKRTIEEKIFVNACQAMGDECKPFDDPEFIAGLDEAAARAEFTRRLDLMGIATGKASEILKQTMEDKTVSDAPVETLRYLLTNWETTKEALTEE